MADRIYLNDTAVIPAFFYDQDGVTPLPASGAEIEVRLPDGTIQSADLGAIQVADVDAMWNNTSQVGLYQGRVRFELGDGSFRSVPITFEVVDPFETSKTQDFTHTVLVGEDYEIPVTVDADANDFYYRVDGDGKSVLVESLYDNVTGALEPDPNNYWNGETVEYAVSYIRSGYETIADPVLSFVVPSGQRVALTFPGDYSPDTALVRRRIDGGQWLPVIGTGGGIVQPDTVPPNDTVTPTDPIYMFGDTAATLRLSHSSPGIYKITVTYLTSANEERGQIFTVKVVDPHDTTTESIESVVDRAWMKLEDLFDSELGGPWLRDKTVHSFDREKMKRFIPDALYTIGATYQPVVMYAEDNFPFDPHAPLLSQALLVETIQHLIRSYIEQPLPTGGGQITYFDRRDYLNRWQAVLDMETTKLVGWIDLFKKEQMGYGSTATLLGGYSNVFGRSPRYMRGRYPYTHVRW